MERGVAVDVGEVWVAEEEGGLDGERAIAGCGVVEDAAPAAVDGVGVGVWKEGLEDGVGVGGGAAGRAHKGGCAFDVLGVGVGERQEDLDCREVFVFGGYLERGGFGFRFGLERVCALADKVWDREVEAAGCGFEEFEEEGRSLGFAFF